MKLRDMAELAGRNLREAMLRNSLTTLGIAVGVASLVAMLSLGVGLQEMASSRLAKSGLLVRVVVVSKANSRRFGGARDDGDAAVPAGPSKRLDDAARAQLAGIPRVTEVYPEVRFQTEIQYDGKPYATMAAGIPLSAQADGAFDNMKGSFFSGADANEAILQIELAKDLSKQPETLIGKEVILRYAERQVIPAEHGAPGSGEKRGGAGAEEGMSTGFSMIPREKKLRIIGIVETEPAAGFGGMGRGRLLIALPTVATQRGAAGGRCGQGHGIRGLFDYRCDEKCAVVFYGVRFAAGNFRELGADGRVIGNHQYAGDGDSGAAPGDWDFEGVGRGRSRCAAAVFCRGGREGAGRRSFWRRAGVVDWEGAYFWDQRVFAPAAAAGDRSVFGAM